MIYLSFKITKLFTCRQFSVKYQPRKLQGLYRIYSVQSKIRPPTETAEPLNAIKQIFYTMKYMSQDSNL